MRAKAALGILMFGWAVAPLCASPPELKLEAPVRAAVGDWCVYRCDLVERNHRQSRYVLLQVAAVESGTLRVSRRRWNPNSRMSARDSLAWLRPWRVSPPSESTVALPRAPLTSRALLSLLRHDRGASRTFLRKAETTWEGGPAVRYEYDYRPSEGDQAHALTVFASERIPLTGVGRVDGWREDPLDTIMGPSRMLRHQEWRAIAYGRGSEATWGVLPEELIQVGLVPR